MVCCSFLCGCGVPVCVVFHVLVGVVRDLLCGDVWFGVVRGVVCLFVCELFNVCVCFMRVCVLCVIAVFAFCLCVCVVCEDRVMLYGVLLCARLCGLCLFVFVCAWLLLFNVFVCFVRDVLCGVVWFVFLCVLSVSVCFLN